MNRSIIYQSYKGFKNYKEKQGKLLKQQVFLSKFISDSYDSIDKMLLFHGIGTGKTCTSITIAETIMNINKRMKVLVILPARLKTNFIDELISETCGLYKYITKQEYKDFIDPNVSSSAKDKIRQSFSKKISVNYDIISYEKLRKTLLDSTDYKNTIATLTKNRIIIIDEVHNLIGSRLNPAVFSGILNEKTINKKLPAINSILLRLITTLADKSCKMFLLTATPVFDNYGQFMQLVLNLKPDTDPNRKDIDYLVNQIRGKVSFYKLDDRSDFPSTVIDNIRVQLSNKQIRAIEELDQEKDDDYEDYAAEDIPEGRTFCMNERQISISLLNKNYEKIIFKNLKEYSPKLDILFKLINEKKGKHVVFSNFIQYCLELIADYLKSKGWSDYTKTGSIDYKTFVLWDASLKDKEKQEVKAVLNSKANMTGKVIRVVLGSPSIKEGISFKHIQHLHQIDPVWNSSAKEQIEGRCIRYKSHEDIPKDHPYLKRQVIIHNYIGCIDAKTPYEENTNGNTTCEEKIYYEIIERKRKIITILEKLLRKVSIDYYIWLDKNKSPVAHSKSSNISVLSAENELNAVTIKIPQNKKKKEAQSCPKPRRLKSGKCNNPRYPFAGINKKGVPCCYAKEQKQAKVKIIDEDNYEDNDKDNHKDNYEIKSKKEPKKANTCLPTTRRPIDGKCKDSKYKYIYLNSNGNICCYTRPEKK